MSIPGPASDARRFKIIELLLEDHRAGVPATAVHTIIERLGPLSVAPNLLENDLKVLIKLGLARRVGHGKYSSAGLFPGHGFPNDNISHPEMKHLIAARCMQTKKPASAGGQFLFESRFLFIFHGTSTEPLFPLIRDSPRDRQPRCVATSSVPGFITLAGCDSIELSCVGGVVDRRRRAFKPYGSEELQKATLRTIEHDVLVVACSRLDFDGRIECIGEMGPLRESVINDTIAEGKDVVVLADRSKFHLGGLARHFAHVPFQEENTWLFVDAVPEGPSDRATLAANRRFAQLRETMGDRFVEVPHSARAPAPPLPVSPSPDPIPQGSAPTFPTPAAVPGAAPDPPPRKPRSSKPGPA